MSENTQEAPENPVAVMTASPLAYALSPDCEPPFVCYNCLCDVPHAAKINFEEGNQEFDLDTAAARGQRRFENSFSPLLL